MGTLLWGGSSRRLQLLGPSACYELRRRAGSGFPLDVEGRREAPIDSRLHPRDCGESALGRPARTLDGLRDREILRAGRRQGRRRGGLAGRVAATRQRGSAGSCSRARWRDSAVARRCAPRATRGPPGASSSLASGRPALGELSQFVPFPLDKLRWTISSQSFAEMKPEPQDFHSSDIPSDWI